MFAAIFILLHLVSIVLGVMTGVWLPLIALVLLWISILLLGLRNNHVEISQLRNERSGDSLETFKASIDSKGIEGEVLQAVYEQFKLQFRFPPRPEDILNHYNAVDKQYVANTIEYCLQDLGMEVSVVVTEEDNEQPETVGEIVLLVDKYYKERP